MIAIGHTLKKGPSKPASELDVVVVDVVVRPRLGQMQPRLQQQTRECGEEDTF
jgi:hypothetical protein